jgi:ATP-binding cassette subfamily B protein
MPLMSAERSRSRQQTLQFARWVWPLLRERRRQALVVVVLSLASSTLVLLQPWLLRILIDEGALRADVGTIAWVCLFMVAASLVGLAIEAVSRFDYLALSSHVLFRLRARVFSKLQGLPPTYYARTAQGDILARFDGDVAEVQRFFVDAPLALCNGLFSLIVGVVIMASMSPALTLLVLVVAPFQIGAGLAMRGRVEQATRGVREQATRLSSHFLDSLRAMKFVQTTHTGDARLSGLRALHGDYHQALHGNQLAGFQLNAVQKMIGTLGNVALLGVGGYFLANGSLSVGVLVAFVVLAPRVAGPLQTISGVLTGWQRCRVSVERLDEILGQPERQVATPGRMMPPEMLRGDIVLDRVTFAYDAQNFVLKDASACFPGGGKTLLLGPSGEGKSTLIDLLLGHFRPASGEIRIAGQELGQFDRAGWRQRVAVVDQEPVFFTGNVRDNLLHVCPDAGDAALIAALLASGYASQPLAPDLLDTPVGAAANRLSRGQRMRLALARAVLQQPDILILDETTSAVDHDMGWRMMAAVDRIFATATRIVITHQSQTVNASDHAYLLRDGQLFDWRSGVAASCAPPELRHAC